MKTVKQELLEATLEVLWKQWSQVGVAGHSVSRQNHVVDIEALLLATCFFGTYDQRLFDEMITWLIVNERFINIQRLQTICKNTGFSAFHLLGPISGYFTDKVLTLKWKGIQNQCHPAKPEKGLLKLFLMPDNRPLPLKGELDPIFAGYGLARLPFKNRKRSGTFTAGAVTSLQLQLRALFGVNSRAETMLYLLSHRDAAIRDITALTGYSWRSTQETLFEMSRSGLVFHPPAKRGRKYRLQHEDWAHLFPCVKTHSIAVMDWSILFWALEQIWLTINGETFGRLSAVGQDIQLKELFQNEINPRFAVAEGNLPLIPFDTGHSARFVDRVLSGFVKTLTQLG